MKIYQNKIFNHKLKVQKIKNVVKKKEWWNLRPLAEDFLFKYYTIPKWISFCSYNKTEKPLHITSLAPISSVEEYRHPFTPSK